MGMFDGMGGGLGAGMFGLGVAGDVFGAYSGYQAQKRQRDLYNQQLQLANTLKNPQAVLAGSEPYYQSALASLNTQIPNIVRSTVAPQLGMQGIDPSGGTGQLILNQALAPYYKDLRSQAIAQYTGSLGQAQNGLYQTGQNIGQPQGGMGNTSAALQAIMRMQGLRGRGATQPPATPMGQPLDDSYGLGGLSQYTTGGMDPYAQQFLGGTGGMQMHG